MIPGSSKINQKSIGTTIGSVGGAALGYAVSKPVANYMTQLYGISNPMVSKGAEMARSAGSVYAGQMLGRIGGQKIDQLRNRR